MIKFGVNESMVIPMLLPGAILCIGSVGTAAVAMPDEVHGWWRWMGGVLAANGDGSPAATLGFVALLAYVASLLGGAVVAIWAGYSEYHVLDRLTAGALGITREEYWEEWQRFSSRSRPAAMRTSTVSSTCSYSS